MSSGDRCTLKDISYAPPYDGNLYDMTNSLTLMVAGAEQWCLFENMLMDNLRLPAFFGDGVLLKAVPRLREPFFLPGGVCFVAAVIKKICSLPKYNFIVENERSVDG